MRGCQASQRKGLTSGEVRGTSGEVFHSEGTSGEVAEKLLGKFGELPGKSRGLPRSSEEPDSLPATRQIYLQISLENFNLA